MFLELITIIVIFSLSNRRFWLYTTLQKSELVEYFQLPWAKSQKQSFLVKVIRKQSLARVQLFWHDCTYSLYIHELDKPCLVYHLNGPLRRGLLILEYRTRIDRSLIKHTEDLQHFSKHSCKFWAKISFLKIFAWNLQLCYEKCCRSSVCFINNPSIWG